MCKYLPLPEQFDGHAISFVNSIIALNNITNK